MALIDGNIGVDELKINANDLSRAEQFQIR